MEKLLKKDVNLEDIDPKKYIIIKNATENNLKGIDLVIPQNKLVVITGVSGSGKTSLAFDTLFAEGQRRYIESLSSYIRQFLKKNDKPAVDYIKGLSPAIAIEQKVNTHNSRSTVGTQTEIYDYLKLLFSRIGRLFSPVSGEEVKRQRVTDVVQFMKTYPDGTKAQILAPLIRHLTRSWEEELKIVLQKGFTRLVLNEQIVRIEDLLSYYQLDTVKNKKQTKDLKLNEAGLENSYILIDRVVIDQNDEENEKRIADSLQTAYFEGESNCTIEFFDENKKSEGFDFSDKLVQDGIEFNEPEIHLFTFNGAYGACPECDGFGQSLGFDEDKVVPDKSLSVYDGAIACWRGEKMKKWQDMFIKNSWNYDFPVHRPYNKLNDEEKKLLWEGNRKDVRGIYEFFDRLAAKKYKIQNRVLIARYSGKTTCKMCKGSRLKKEAGYVKINGKNIQELVEMPVTTLYTFIKSLKLDSYEQKVSFRILEEIISRLELMINVGLPYLTLNRSSNTLSGGESQRIHLVNSLGSNLTGSLYILDEPTIGLHARDSGNLVKVLKKLRDLGNTVIIVEHDEEIIRAADHIIDIGPGAGSLGGEVVYEGSLQDMLSKSKSLTAAYLNKSMQVAQESESKMEHKNFLSVKSAARYNLNNIDIMIPLNALTVVSGVSGSGKSTLVDEVLYKSLKSGLEGSIDVPTNCKEINFDRYLVKAVEYVSQSPVGRSSRSNPATYLKVFDAIRDIYAKLPESKMQGLTPGNFSFNIDGGRCPMCKGEGIVNISMQFMADVELTCEHCSGKRYQDHILEICLNGKSIMDVLDMTVLEAMEFFKEKYMNVVKLLSPLKEVGLDYVTLGQSSAHLSGGELQRIKLATYIQHKERAERTFFIFDEPTTGLHFHDISKLLKSIRSLISFGHTVVIVEHNLDVIRHADWVIDLGPEGGDKGGEVMYQGVVSGFYNAANSLTADYLIN